MKLVLPLLMLGGAGFSLPTLAADLPVAHDELLRRTAISVAGFWDELQAVNCVETVGQQKLNPNGKPMFRQQTDFDYRSEEHTSELQSLRHLVCRLLLEK